MFTVLASCARMVECRAEYSVMSNTKMTPLHLNLPSWQTVLIQLTALGTYLILGP